MDMYVVRETAKKLGPLPDARVNSKGKVRVDIFVDTDHVHTVTRKVPVPVWGDYGKVKKGSSGEVLYTIVPLTLKVPALSRQSVVGLVNRPEGMYERTLENLWAGFNYRSRPWSKDANERVEFKYVRVEELESYQEYEIVIEEG